MAKKRLQLELIPNETARRATFRKRKQGIVKKVSQLSTLCGVSALAIIYGPYDSMPVFWPPSLADAKDVIARFKSLSEMEQSKKMVNHEEFLRERVKKLKEKLKWQVKENQELEAKKLMHEFLAGNIGLQDLSLEVLSDLTWLIETKIMAIGDRINELLKHTTASSPSLQQFISRELDHERSNNVVGDGKEEVSGGENMAMEPLHGQPALSMNANVMNRKG